MKTVALILALLSPCATYASDWTKGDTALQSAYTALHVIDWLQTLDSAHNPYEYKTSYQNGSSSMTQYKRHENNIILGRHPSTAAISAYFASTLVAHTVVSYLLPKPWREAWQGLGIGIEGAVVARNFSMGLSIGF